MKEWHWSLSTGMTSCLHDVCKDNGRRCGVIGSVDSEHGIVMVYQDVRGPTFAFIHAGKKYFREFDQEYSERYVITLARRFARDVVNAADVDVSEARGHRRGQ